MFDIKKRKRFSTVGELQELIKDIPDETEICICGVDDCWFHIKKDDGTICLDNEDLEYLYED